MNLDCPSFPIRAHLHYIPNLYVLFLTVTIAMCTSHKCICTNPCKIVFVNILTCASMTTLSISGHEQCRIEMLKNVVWSEGWLRLG